MSLRAVIFDVYGTLLELSPAPADAAERWEFLWEDFFADPARLTLEEFEGECKKAVVREHAAARLRGVNFPEVDWVAMAREALPELARVSDERAADFLYAHARLRRTVRVTAVAAATLELLRGKELPLGIVSNSQAYTLRELDAALAAHGLDRNIFKPELCFWSFEHGYSKPDPGGFRLVAARLEKAGITAGEAMVVGDRQDNDIEPARRDGWQTWRLTKAATVAEEHAGNWQQLQEFLKGRIG